MGDTANEMLRLIPGVDRLLMNPAIERISSVHPRNLILRGINLVLEEIRNRIISLDLIDAAELEADHVSGLVVKKVKDLSLPSLRPVINATGVVIHTNLGRSILAKRVIQKFGPLSGGYSNLEYDLKKGKRGSRYIHVEGILKELTSAESAMVVNNNAAAVLICLETLARGREVIVSRGQLVEIGGSFRIPDVMKKSGARMVEVGTTNKTHEKDYLEAIGPETALLLKVHKSNFQLIGFTEDVGTPDLAKIGKKYGIPVMEDLGSGCLVDLSKYGVTKEPTVQEVLEQGADLVTFSGDKLLGGPQAGIILGRKDLIESIKGNPLNRALRIDKLTLLALEETLDIYRDEKDAMNMIPTLEMICRPYKNLRTIARRFIRTIGKCDDRNFRMDLVDGKSKVGGGALPLCELPTRILRLIPHKMSAKRIEEWLRAYDPPIIVRVEDGNVMMDMRTIRNGEFKVVARAIRDLSVNP
ncbi:MAG: L-seryl-tRNA(Sec) selenium transferase [Deltaproteobacteria bacterium]|nr:L-seryl-tRNA(Sec) selenium transferase [Deltaproteobacteria bacterium]